MIRIELTEEQKLALQGLFSAVRKANGMGGIASIVAQVWEDGFVAKVLHNEQATSLARALGGSLNSTEHSSAGRMQAENKRIN